jgi:hypothetical protein
VEAIFAFYKGHPSGSASRVLDPDPGKGRQKLSAKKGKMKKFHV